MAHILLAAAATDMDDAALGVTEDDAASDADDVVMEELPEPQGENTDNVH